MSPWCSLGIIISPWQTLGELAKAPRWFTQFLLLCLGTIGANLALQPFTRKVTFLHLESLLPSDELERALTYVDQWFCLGVIFAPLFLLAKCGFSTIVIRGMGRLLGLRAEFRKTFAIVVWSSTPLVLEMVCISIVLWLRGIEDVQAPSDLEVPLGVNLFLTSNNPVLFGLLGSLNPFELWFVSLLSVGIARVHSISIPMGFLIAAPLWLGGITVQSTLRFLAL